MIAAFMVAVLALSPAQAPTPVLRCTVTRDVNGDVYLTDCDWYLP